MAEDLEEAVEEVAPPVVSVEGEGGVRRLGVEAGDKFVLSLVSCLLSLVIVM